MPKPKAICIEDVTAKSGESTFLRCVALAGRAPGLRVDAKGEVLWKSDEGTAFELWVSADEKLILYRPQGAPAVALHRAGRSLEVPCGKPVVVIDRDEVEVGERRLRIHVHGDASSVAAPSPFNPEPSALGRLARAAAAAAVIGSGVAGCNIKDIIVRDSPPAPPPIDVRDAPPEVAAPDLPDEPPADGETGTDGADGEENEPGNLIDLIEVRDNPPEPLPDPGPEPPAPPLE